MEFNATFIFAIASFVIFAFLMNIILYKPISRIVAKREEYYKNNNDVVVSNETEASSIINEKNDKVLKAKFDSKEQVSYFQNSAVDKKTQLINESRSDLESAVRLNLDSLNNEKDLISNEIDKNAEEISDIILNKLIGGKDA